MDFNDPLQYNNQSDTIHCVDCQKDKKGALNNPVHLEYHNLGPICSNIVPDIETSNSMHHFQLAIIHISYLPNGYLYLYKIESLNLVIVCVADANAKHDISYTTGFSMFRR